MENKEQNKQVVVETFAEDMANAFGESGGGELKNIIHAEEAKLAEENSWEKKENKIFGVLSVVLWVVALGALAFILVYQNSRRVVLTPVVRQMINLAGIEKSEFGVSDLVALGFREEGVEFISGVLAGSWESQPFLLLEVVSTTDVFNIFRGWEGEMFLNLDQFFSFSTTLSSATRQTILLANFVDDFIYNKNARVLKGPEEGIVLAYVFADSHHILIAQNMEAMREVLIRLSASEFRK